MNFFGDFCVRKIDNLQIGDKLSERIKESKFNVVNFESPIKDVFSQQVEKSGPSHFQDSLAPSFLEESGFNVIALANNHIMDYGEDALFKTISSFKKSKCFGAGYFDDAYSVLRLRVDGKTIGLLGITQNEFGTLDDVSYRQIGTAWMCHPKVDEEIVKARKDCDLLIIIVHAGLEMFDYPLPELRTLYRHYIEMGADAVVGGHPHVPQGMEYYNNKPIIYSLGNFCFDKKSEAPHWYDSIMAMFTYDSGILSVEMIPIYYDIANRVVEVNFDKCAYDRILKLSQTLGSDEYMNMVNEKCLQLTNHYNMLYSMSGYYQVNNIRSCIGCLKRQLVRLFVDCFRPSQVHLINNVRCETHRWVQSRIYELTN